MNHPTLPGIDTASTPVDPTVDPDAPAPFDVAMDWIRTSRLALALAKARANRRPHPDEAAVLRRARALTALDNVHWAVVGGTGGATSLTPRTEARTHV